MSTESLADKVLRLSSTGHGIIPITSIFIAPDRMREDTPAERTYINEDLLPSIAQYGLIQLPCLNEDPNLPAPFTHELVSGWCRTEACKALGLTHIPYNLRSELTPSELSELELEENVRRRNMRWQDICVGIARTHKKKVREHGVKGETWGMKQTGDLVGQSHGYVSEAIKIAGLIRAGDEGICKAPSFAAAKDVLLKRKEDEAAAKLASLTGAVPQTKKPTPQPSGPRTSLDISSIAASFTDSPQTDSAGEPVQKSLVENVEINLGSMLFNEDNRDFFARTLEGTYDLIYTDIPYGIDMDNLDFGSDDLERVKHSHDVDENISQMQGFLVNAFHALKDERYLVFWYDLAHHEKLVEWGKEAGFTVCPYPYIWCKEHPCRNRAGNIWPTKAHETAMIMRKGKGLLQSPMTKSFIFADGSAERKMQKNPFSKPFAVNKDIITHFTMPGDTMLDCYAGEGSLVRAGLNLGRRVTAVEKDKAHFDHLVVHVRDVYTELTRGKAVFS